MGIHWTSTDFLIYSTVAVVGIVIMKFLVDWMWSVSKRNRILKAQLKMLAEIARKHGVSDEKIQDAFNDADASNALLDF